jgi:hypothetical protein
LSRNTWINRLPGYIASIAISSKATVTRARPGIRQRQRIQAAKPHSDLVAGKLFEAFDI